VVIDLFGNSTFKVTVISRKSAFEVTGISRQFAFEVTGISGKLAWQPSSAVSALHICWWTVHESSWGLQECQFLPTSWE